MNSYDDPLPPLFDPKDLVKTTTTLKDPSDCRHKLNQYICGEKIGKGKHGDVYICENETGGHKLVCFSFFLPAFVSILLLRRSKLLSEVILAIKSNF